MSLDTDKALEALSHGPLSHRPYGSRLPQQREPAVLTVQAGELAESEPLYRRLWAAATAVAKMAFLGEH